MKKIERILIIRLSSLGDIILTTPILKAMRKKFPEAEIYYLTKKDYVELLDTNPYINKIINIDTYDGVMGVISLIKAISSIRKLKIDLVVDMHFRHWSYFRTALWNLFLVNCIGASIKIKSYKSPFRHKQRTRVLQTHVVDLHFQALKNIGISTKENHPELFLSPKEKNWADYFLNENGFNKKDRLIGISPTASWRHKEWGGDNFQCVCESLIKNLGVKLIFFGKKNELSLINLITQNIKSDKMIYATGLSLKEVASLIDRCELVLCNDSGIMHMASSLARPVVAIFGPTHPSLGFYPLDKNRIILHADTSCSPCSRWGEKKCKYKQQLCFSNLSTELVFNKIKESLLNSKTESSKTEGNYLN